MDGTLSETCILNVYERINHQNAKNHGIEHIWEYKTTLRKKVFCVFLSLTTKTLKSMQNTLYEGT